MAIERDDFASQVKDVRQQIGISQEDLARALGVSFATVNRWENGKTIPSKLGLKQFVGFCKKMTKAGKLSL